MLSRDKTRLSISGWFHGETAAFPRKADPLPLLKEPPVEDGVTEDEGGNRRPCHLITLQSGAAYRS